jgi:hypothetical protein
MTMSRTLAIASVLVFVTAFFAMPLYAAMTICTMPCCQHQAQELTAGCAAGCAIRTEAPKSETFVPEKRAVDVVAEAPTVTVVDAVPAIVPSFDRDTPPVRTAAPLHLLNSIFRI